MKQYKITVNGQSYEVQVEELGGSAPVSQAATKEAPASVASPPRSGAAAPAPGGAQGSGQGSGVVKSPMPGTLMSYKVSLGQELRKGDVVLILEAMKMENEIVAPIDGRVLALNRAEGDSVNTGDPLLEIGS